MDPPEVSIVILSYFHPQITSICLETLAITKEVDYEVIVVDNGSDDETREMLHSFKNVGLIDKLILEPENRLYSVGNNIGVAQRDPSSEYVLLLNSDVGFMRPDWLFKMLAWMDGTILHHPSVWPHHPAHPDPGPYDIVSLGWSWDNQLHGGYVRPEGWCCLYRTSVWQDMPAEFPWLYGLDLQITNIARAGAKVGVLSQYGSYLVHREGGSSSMKKEMPSAQPDLPSWYDGVKIWSLDFELGPNEHDSYLWW